MTHVHPPANEPRQAQTGLRTAAFLFGLVLLGAGCAALSNPVADGIPVRELPDEYRGKSREGYLPIPLTMLRQKPINDHLVGPGDVLGIVIENVLGDPKTPAQIHFPQGAGNGGLAPGIGFPILVQDNGTISLPYVPPIKITGLTLQQVQDKILDEYTVKQKIIRKGAERILVTLLQPRRSHILVVREDSGSAGTPAGPTFGTTAPLVGASKKGTGVSLDLPVGENDVMNALTRTGGLPGTDAKNEVIIYKKNPSKENPSGVVIRIPLRLRPDEAPPFKPSDVILENGDIVYIESRETEIFYTAGLLGSGYYNLPRDFDLDIIMAIQYVRGPLLNGGFGQAQFVANAINSGLGNESPSLVTVLRKTASGKQLPIRIDLNSAIKDPRERINILPGDILVMQEKPGEAVARYLSQALHLGAFGTLIRQRDLTATGTFQQ